MPKWECKSCGHEFWGWGIYYNLKAGERLQCPDCDGELVNTGERTEQTTGVMGPYTSTAPFVWKRPGLD